MNLDQLTGGTRHKKRYGRATLTIRSRGGLTGASELARALERYTDGAATADDVVSAFIAYRVESHSATFDWAQVDRDRVLKLVASCSDSPKISDTSAEAVAKALLRARDEEIDQANQEVRKLVESLNKSVSGSIQTLARSIGLVQSQRWAEHQAALTRNLSPQFSAPRMRFPLTLGAITSTPTFPPGLLASASVQLPAGPADEIAKSFRSTFAQLQYSPPAAFRPILAGQALRLADVSQVATAAADISREQHQPAYATRLSEIASELDDVSREGSVRVIEQLFDQLTDELHAMEERQIERESTAEARAEARDVRATALFIIGVYITILLFLLGLLLEPSAGDPAMSPPQPPSMARKA